jgi:hypothetical protein
MQVRRLRHVVFGDGRLRERLFVRRGRLHRRVQPIVRPVPLSIRFVSRLLRLER